MAQITWKIIDEKLTKAHADLMAEHGKTPFGKLQTFIRIVSSDVGASGANIFYSILDGDYTIVLGEALRTKHRHKQGIGGNLLKIWNLFLPVLQNRNSKISENCAIFVSGTR